MADAAQDFLSNQLANNSVKAATTKKPSVSSGAYAPGWRAQKADGETAWGSQWEDGAYAQQLQGSGSVDPGYLNQFDSLAKGDSDIDDDGQWRTVKSIENSGANTRADMKALAAEWQAKGFDVRVQDLDNSQGAGWADIAVRKGTGKAEATKAKPKPTVLSDTAAEAIAYTKSYEDVMLPRQGDYTILNDQSVVSDMNDAYKLNLRKAKAPQPAQGESQSASSYAQNYKLSVGDTLTSNNNFI